MAGQSGDANDDRVAIDGAPAQWLRERARSTNLSPEEYLERVVASLRAVEDGDPLDDLATTDEFADLEARVDDLDAELLTKIADVRDRVVQVKREVDGKAPHDHDHGDLRDDLRELTESLETVEQRLERGFENYEEILRYLVDEMDDRRENAASLATALVALRHSAETLRAHEQRRRAAEGLQKAANLAGVTEARCDACDSEVTVALLTEPACPFCGATLADVTPNPGFFGSATLETGPPPALEKGDAPDTVTLDDIAETGGAEDGRPDDPLDVLDEDGSLVDVTRDEPATDDPPEDGSPREARDE